MLRRLLTIIFSGCLAILAFGMDIDMVSPGPPNLAGVVFTDTRHGVVLGVQTKGSPNSAIAWTEDGGENWTDAKITVDITGIAAESLCMINATTGLAVVYGGTPRRQVLLKTEDGGKTWMQQAAPALEKMWVLGQIWFAADGKRGWVNTSGGPLYQTTDGGETWTPVRVDHYTGGPFTYAGKPIPGNFVHSGMYAFSFDHLLLCGDCGMVLETTDAGATWAAQCLPMTSAADRYPSLWAVHFAPDGISGWIIGGEGDFIRNPNGHAQFKDSVVLRTSDGGKHWARVKIDRQSPPSDVWAVSAQEAWICAPRGFALQTPPSGYLLHTIDGGKTWKNEHPGTGSLAKCFFLDAAHGWVAGGRGGGIEPESVVLLIRK